jgi:FRG domain
VLNSSAMDINDITTEKPFTSVSELIDLRETLEGSKFTSPPNNHIAYRGQSQNFGTLAPSFQRQFSKQSVGTAELIESRLMYAFREHYENLDDRSNDMPQPIQIAGGHDMRCLSVMQHYEIPTRLLDWSTNFWTSVYFASASDPGATAELWYYDRRIFDNQRMNNPSYNTFMDRTPNPPSEPPMLSLRDNIIVELDPQISPRMKKQNALHTVSTNVFSDHAPLLLDLQLFSVPEGETLFHRILIAAEAKSRILQFLADAPLNITASTIFPDVVGLGRFLRWQFDSLRTMLL